MSRARAAIREASCTTISRAQFSEFPPNTQRCRKCGIKALRRTAVLVVCALILSATHANANPNCKEGRRPDPGLPIVATKTVTASDSGVIRVGVGGPVFVHVVNKGPTTGIRMFVHRPGADLLHAICDNVAILTPDEEFWMQVYFVADDAPTRVVEVLANEKTAKLEVSVYKGTAVLPTTLNDRVTIRMRAFIPNAIQTNPSYVRKVPAASKAWMIPGPIEEATRALKIDLSGDCFMTDNRGFDSAKTASARVWTEFDIVVYYGQVSIQPVSDGRVHRAGESVRLGCADGKVVEKKWADLGTRALGRPSIADGKIQIAGQASGPNPHFDIVPATSVTPAINIAPAINYSFDLIYDTTTHGLVFSLTVGVFPAFEAYALRGGKTVTLTAQDPVSESAWGLIDGGLGLNTVRIRGAVQL